MILKQKPELLEMKMQIRHTRTQNITLITQNEIKVRGHFIMLQHSPELWLMKQAPYTIQTHFIWKNVEDDYPN